MVDLVEVEESDGHSYVVDLVVEVFEWVLVLATHVEEHVEVVELICLLQRFVADLKLEVDVEQPGEQVLPADLLDLSHVLLLGVLVDYYLQVDQFVEVLLLHALLVDHFRVEDLQQRLELLHTLLQVVVVRHEVRQVLILVVTRLHELLLELADRLLGVDFARVDHDPFDPALLSL